MRGAVSGGALQALHDLGFKSCFDSIYGSSAGAINATYFLADQREGVDVYSQDITNTQFIDLKRLLKKKDVVQSQPLPLPLLPWVARAQLPSTVSKGFCVCFNTKPPCLSLATWSDQNHITPISAHHSHILSCNLAVLQVRLWTSPSCWTM